MDENGKQQIEAIRRLEQATVSTVRSCIVLSFISVLAVGSFGYITFITWDGTLASFVLLAVTAFTAVKSGQFILKSLKMRLKVRQIQAQYGSHI